MVILMLACKIEIGKSGWGLELSQRRKEGCGSSTCSCSTSLSRLGIHDSDRWQLARNTQCPARRCWMQWEPFPMPHLSPHFPPDCVCGGWERWGPNAQVPPLGPSGEVGAAVTAGRRRWEVVGSRARDTDGGRTGWILTLNHTLSEEPSRDGGLALAQRQGMEALRHACVLCQLEQGTGGVHAGGQDKYEWGPRG